MIQTYPEYPIDCIQYMVHPWWVEADIRTLCRGQLIWAFVPHVDQVPMALRPIGRKEANQHKLADCEIKAMSIKESISHDDSLPVAGLLCYSGECRVVLRAKKRPMVVVAVAGDVIPEALVKNYPKYQTAPTHLALPYYGADSTSGRSGFSPEFLERVRHCEYRQFAWDMLPIRGSSIESVLRLDHLQPISTHYKSFETTPFKLSDEGMEVLEDWLDWHITGELPEHGDAVLSEMRDMLLTEDIA